MFHLTTSSSKNNITLTCGYDDLFYFIKGSVYYLSSILDKDDNEILQLIRCLQTYCILYCTDKIKETSSQPLLALTYNTTPTQTQVTTNVDIKNEDQIPSVLDVTDNELFEFWATFTSCWNIFVKYNLDGLYLLLITFRTFDSEKITISKEITQVIYQSLLIVYPYNKEDLNELVNFFYSATKNKLSIESTTVSQNKYLL